MEKKDYNNTAELKSYLALVPRGLDHVVQDMVASTQLTLSSSRTREQGLQHKVVETTAALVGEEEELQRPEGKSSYVQRIRNGLLQKESKQEQQQQQQKKRQRRRQTVSNGSDTCRIAPVGTLQEAPKKHVSVGYDGSCNECVRQDVWTVQGHLQGTCWLRIETKAPAHVVANLRCLGPLLSLVHVLEGLQLNDQQSLEEAVQQIQLAMDKIAEQEYSNKFLSAVQLWRDHVCADWTRYGGQVKSILKRYPRAIKYRLSCVRNDSKKYSYTREQLIRGLADIVVPTFEGHEWSVDLTNYDVEVVILVQSHCLAIGLALRPYQSLSARSFRLGVVPPDVSRPFLANTSSYVRLRPSTASALLHLAHLRPGDLVLDPCAGVGTIPIEAALSRRGICALGGDLALTDANMRSWVSTYRLQAASMQREETKTTSCSLGGTAELSAWDAAQLPLRSGIVDAVVSDLPFGQQCMSSTKLDGLIPLLVGEMARVLQPETGRMVLLCGSYVPILEALQNANEHSLTTSEQDSDSLTTYSAAVWRLPCTAVFPVNIGGHLAWVVKVQRGSGESVPLRNHKERVRKLTRKRERITQITKNDKAGRPKRVQA